MRKDWELNLKNDINLEFSNMDNKNGMDKIIYNEDGTLKDSAKEVYLTTKQIHKDYYEYFLKWSSSQKLNDIFDILSCPAAYIEKVPSEFIASIKKENNIYFDFIELSIRYITLDYFADLKFVFNQLTKKEVGFFYILNSGEVTDENESISKLEQIINNFMDVLETYKKKYLSEWGDAILDEYNGNKISKKSMEIFMKDIREKTDRKLDERGEKK